MKKTPHEVLLLLKEELVYRDGNFYWVKSKAGRRLWQPAGRTTQRHQEIMIDGVRYSTHSLVWLWHHGVWPTMLDHINRDHADNRIENLRLADRAANNWNKTTPVNNTTGHKHITWEAKRKRWVGAITSNGTLQRKSSTNLETILAWRDSALSVRGAFNPLDIIPKVQELRIDKFVEDVT